MKTMSKGQRLLGQIHQVESTANPGSKGGTSAGGNTAQSFRHEGRTLDEEDRQEEYADEESPRTSDTLSTLIDSLTISDDSQFTPKMEKAEDKIMILEKNYNASAVEVAYVCMVEVVAPEESRSNPFDERKRKSGALPAAVARSGAVTGGTRTTKKRLVSSVEEAKEGQQRRVVSHKSNDVVDREVKECNRVKKALAAFRQVVLENDREYRADPNKQKGANDYIEAATYLKKRGKWVNTEKRTGHIPGVKIGDKFQYRAELAVVGLHTQFQSGIDYMKLEDKTTTLATSIVESGRYGKFSNTIVSPDVMTYIGQGGHPYFSKAKPKDQKPERGNLALMNSKEAGTPVRVIRSYKIGDESGYVYDGLYMVEDFWQERGDFDKLVFKFLLTRMSDQPKLTLGN